MHPADQLEAESPHRRPSGRAAGPRARPPMRTLLQCRAHDTLDSDEALRDVFARSACSLSPALSERDELPASDLGAPGENAYAFRMVGDIQTMHGALAALPLERGVLEAEGAK